MMKKELQGYLVNEQGVLLALIEHHRPDLSFDGGQKLNISETKYGSSFRLATSQGELYIQITYPNFAQDCRAAQKILLGIVYEHQIIYCRGMLYEHW